MPTKFGQFHPIKIASDMFNRYKFLREILIKVAKFPANPDGDETKRYFTNGNFAFVYNQTILKELLERVAGADDVIIFYPGSRTDKGVGRTTLIAGAYKYELNAATGEYNYNLVLDNSGGQNDLLEQTGGGDEDVIDLKLGPEIPKTIPVGGIHPIS